MNPTALHQAPAKVGELVPGLDWRRLAAPLERAAEAVARLDERLRDHAALDGWRARIDYHDACAAIWMEGELASLEDVVLREAGMDVRLASDATNRALAVLRTRRRLMALSPDRVLTREELTILGAGRPAPDDERPVWFDEPVGDGDPLADFLAELPALGRQPGVLAAAIGLEIWRQLDPAPRQSSLGLLVAASLLRKNGRTRHHLATLALGMKEARLRFKPGAPSQERIEIALAGFEAGALAGRRELDRLSIAAERIAAKCRGRRADSRLPDLGRLLLEMPLVSAPLAARRLRVSQQAVQKLMGELEGVAREVTGRGRYRAWAIL